MQKLLNADMQLAIPLTAQQLLHLRKKLVIELYLEKCQ